MKPDTNSHSSPSKASEFQLPHPLTWLPESSKSTLGLWTPVAIRKASFDYHVWISSACFSKLKYQHVFFLQHLRKDLLHSLTGRLWNTVRRVRIGPSCSWGYPHRRFLSGWRGLWPTWPPRLKHCLGLAARALPVTLCCHPQGRQPRTLCMYCPALRLRAPAQSWSGSGLSSSGRTKNPS